jgi:CIC family chloride channel protein
VGVATVLRTALLDAPPLFAMAPSAPIGVVGLGWCLAFGVVGGAEAAAIAAGLYALEDAYRRIPGSGPVTRPMVGALAVAVIALSAPEVLGVGYDLLRVILNDQASLAELLRLLLAKSTAWLVALASGTVGGVLAPLFIVAGSTGGILGKLLAPLTGMSPGIVALVFMGAVFGAGARIVLTASVFAAEVTGNFAALVPVLVATAVATIVAERILPYNIMTGKLVRRGLRFSHDYFPPSRPLRGPRNPP